MAAGVEVPSRPLHLRSRGLEPRRPKVRVASGHGPCPKVGWSTTVDEMAGSCVGAWRLADPPQHGELVANHIKPWIVLAVVALLATVLWRGFGNQASTALPPTERQAPAEVAADAAVGPHDDLRTAIASTDAAAVEVRDVETDQLIAGVVFTPAAGAAASIGPTAEDRQADAGTLPLAELQSRVDWLVYAPGYVPISFRRPDGAAVVHLTKGHSLDVVVRHEAGDPAADAQVWVYPARSARKFQLAANTILGVGNPSQELPTWGGLTDAEGRATIRGVPEGTYRLQVEHAAGFPELGLPRGEIDIALPTAAPVLVGLLDFHVAAFRPPAGVALAHWSWLRPSGLAMSNIHFVYRRLALQELERRFPDDATYVGRLEFEATSRDRVITIRALFDDNTRGLGEAGLVPLRELADAVVIEPRSELHFRLVVCKFVDVSGALVPLQLRWNEVRTDGRRVFPRKEQNGVPVLLPPGRYRVLPSVPLQFDAVPIPSVEIEVSEASPDSIERTVVLDSRLRLTRMHPTVPESCTAPLHLSVLAGGVEFSVLNWVPGKGPIELLLPAGPVQVKADSPRFKPSTFEFHAQPGVGPQDVKVPVQLVD